MIFAKKTRLKCKGCAQAIEQDWKVCPWCEEKVQSPEPDAAPKTTFPDSSAERKRWVMEQFEQRVQKLGGFGRPDENQDSQAPEAVVSLLKEIVDTLPAISSDEKDTLLQTVKDEMFGFGPLGPLLRDASVQEIWIKNAKSISVLKDTEFEPTNLSFDSEWHLHRTLDKVFWQADAPVRVLIRQVNQ